MGWNGDWSPISSKLGLMTTRKRERGEYSRLNGALSGLDAIRHTKRRFLFFFYRNFDVHIARYCAPDS